GRRAAAGAAALGTVGYVALLGAPHSAARAALQIVLVLAARVAQRPTRTESLIATAALVLLAADPSALVQPGFQLSFAGVAGIVALRRPLLLRLGPLSGWRVAGRAPGRWLADGLATSVAATLATAPIVAWHFGRVAPVGIVANLVGIPLLGAAVPALALALVAGSLWLPAGRFLAGGAELLLDLLDRTASVAAAVPFGTVAAPPWTALAWTTAAVIGYMASRRLGRVRLAVRGAVWAGTAGAVLLVAPLRPVPDRLEIHVIDVGQGDAIAIRSPAGRWLLVDAGVAARDYDAGAARVVPYLQRHGVRRLEGLIITHADGDHMGGAGAVVEALRPRWVGGPAVVVGKPTYLDLLERVRSRGAPWLAMRRGMELELDGAAASILFPDRAGLDAEDVNDASVVMRVAYGEFAALLTGDASAHVETRLVRRYGDRLDADLLKVGHHGSNTSTTPELLRATGATIAAVSVGRRNRYGHPHAAVLRRLSDAGITIYRTDRDGSVTIGGRPDGAVTVDTEKGRGP
ncbi:MAG: DNA internalization-related competence protein ComEC/Rec2, partial [Gemmatimonadota bacterium]